MEDMGYSANMVGRKENSANQIGFSDSSTDLEKETTVVTSSKMGVEIGFDTYYIAEHYTEEAEKKRMDQRGYLFVVAATSSAD